MRNPPRVVRGKPGVLTLGTLESAFMRRVLSVFVLLMATACDTTCEQACNKLIKDCGAGFPSYNAETCQEECELVQKEYGSYDYLVSEKDAFQRQLDCLGESSCEDILNPNQPACYNVQEGDAHRLFAF